MEKEEVLEHVRAAKSAHIKWVQKAKMLINGIDIEEDAIPVNPTSCKFGKWFYSDGQLLNSLANNPVECMERIESLHSELHDVYLKIFSLYFKKEESGFFAKLFSMKKKKLSEDEIVYAKREYDKLERISKELLEDINRLERRLISTADEKIRNLV